MAGGGGGTLSGSVAFPVALPPAAATSVLVFTAAVVFADVRTTRVGVDVIVEGEVGAVKSDTQARTVELAVDPLPHVTVTLLYTWLPGIMIGELGSVTFTLVMLPGTDRDDKPQDVAVTPMHSV